MYTQEQIDNRTSDDVCLDCGRLFLNEKQLKEERVTTCWNGECGLCGAEGTVTDMKHFNYLVLPGKLRDNENMENN